MTSAIFAARRIQHGVIAEKMRLRAPKTHNTCG
jgi:hypothetical protein